MGLTSDNGTMGDDFADDYAYDYDYAMDITKPYVLVDENPNLVKPISEKVRLKPWMIVTMSISAAVVVLLGLVTVGLCWYCKKEKPSREANQEDGEKCDHAV